MNDTALGLADAYKEMIERTIVMPVDDLRAVVHDCIGDTPLVDIYASGSEWWEDPNNRGGEYCRFDELRKLEERIIDALLENFGHAAEGMGARARTIDGPARGNGESEGRDGGCPTTR